MTEIHPLTTQDVQDFVQHPEEELDTFGIMAGSVVGTFAALNTLSPENQLIVFDHLLSYTWCCYTELNNKWRRTTHEDAEKIVGDRMLAEQFPSSRDTVDNLGNPLSSPQILNAQLRKAHSTIFDMFAEKTLSVNEKNGQRSNTSSGRKNAPSTIASGRTSHSNPNNFRGSRLLDILSSE